MDDGNAELSDKLSNNVLFLNPESSSSFQASASVNTVPELCRSSSRTCTHTHTCNPPGPDAAHTHTCYHSHTQIFGPEDDDDKEHTNSKPKRPSGNREAVRKYREKKKAHTAYLEEEVKKLRLVNQQLARKLQGQAHLEAELARLRSILALLKGKIDSELGAFPFQNQCSSYILKEGDAGLLSTAGTIGLRCQNGLPCFHPHAGSSSQVNICAYGKSVSPWEGNCQPEIVDCHVDANNLMSTEGQTVETVDNFLSSASQEG
ncbi:hypothetical protein PHAVU_005G034400 [Phaseolus vulgaris]|uniref:BZIP domain-containing protein n=1 Tax=Phaseolus vulgaris TaxID=3885 RepID=V7BWT3_PHAVU|nr:hypothetical protein PHAVU_005G034400g [Phaseolus vulgaris]XP_007149028.1 hypothetical protein PHAVU_005G034400g [Phaseolus vulgaris]ESW21021.1 hypothetical protein PHAVU_005G034400g [Phaseolus vulgaris]ESW21022.1 hypothetical protein PHAVU_005G034400g [Phaseolus vulgaris]